MPPEILEHGLLGMCLLVIYGLVDKVIVPLATGRQGRKSNGAESSGPSAQWQHQEYINTIHGQRLDRHDAELSEFREVASQVRSAVNVSQAVLERIEDRLE